MHIKRAKSSLTLVELLIGIILMASAFLTLTTISIFFINHTSTNEDRAHIHLMINYAFEDIRLRCISARRLADASVFASTGTTLSEFTFEGEKDMYTITPEDSSDNIWYTYRIDKDNNLVLEEKANALSAATKREILIDKKYKPAIEFQYIPNTEPNFLKVSISAETRKLDTNATQERIIKSDGVRFWFINVVL